MPVQAKPKDTRVVFVTLERGTISMLAYNNGNGPVRVYPNEKEIDGRLLMGDPDYTVVEDEETMYRLMLENKCSQLLVRLPVAKSVFPEFEYDE